MPTATISAKGWVVIPAECRKKHHLEPGTKVNVVDYGGVVAIVPALADPVREARGILKSRKSLSKALLNERKTERKREASR